MIIGLCGAKGCGKSTVFANHLIRHHNFMPVNHADPIKEIMRSLGLTYEEIDGHLKETPNARLSGKTPRYAMQTLGAEWGRSIMGEDFWLNIWRDKVSQYKNVVADGVRFHNEVESIKELGGIIIKIRRPSIEGQSDHSTEIYSSTLDHDYEIYNEEDNPVKGLVALDSIVKKH